MATAPEHPPVTARRRAAALAGYTGGEAAARSALADPDGGVRRLALGALARLGALREADLLAAWSDPDPLVRRRACEVVARGTWCPQATAQLVALLADPDPVVVDASCHALGEILAPGAPHRLANGQQQLNRCLGALRAVARSHDDPLCREAAVAALGAIGHPAGLPAVLEALADKPAIRRRAVVALAAFEEPEATAGLERSLADRDWQVRQVAEDLLGRRPRPAPGRG